MFTRFNQFLQTEKPVACLMTDNQLKLLKDLMIYFVTRERIMTNRDLSPSLMFWILTIYWSIDVMTYGVRDLFNFIGQLSDNRKEGGGVDSFKKEFLQSILPDCSDRTVLSEDCLLRTL